MYHRSGLMRGLAIVRYDAVCVFICGFLGVSGLNTPSEAADADAIVRAIDAQCGSVCNASLEGWLWSSKTLKIDWTASTTKLHALKILAEVADVKSQLYDAGVRYFKFPNDTGGYNIIDWKTGEKTSVSERAPYSFGPASAPSTNPPGQDQNNSLPPTRLTPGESANLRGDGHLARGEYDLAIGEYDEAIRLGHASSYYDRALAWFEKGYYVRSISDFSEWIKYDPQDVHAYLKRGLAYEKRGDRNSAMADYRKASAMNRDRETQKDINIAIRRLATSKGQSFEPATTQDKSAAAADSFLNSGKIHQQRGEYDLAIADFTEALRQNNLLAWLGRGNAFYGKRDYDRAIIDYTEAIRFDPNATAYTNRGKAYENKGELKQALMDYKVALSLERQLQEAVDGAQRVTQLLARSPTAPTPTSSPPGNASDEQVIQQRCRGENIVAYCEKKQRDAAQYLASGKGKPEDILEDQYVIVRKKCSNYWPTDFEGRAFCEDQQFRAIRRGAQQR
jgi:tetratricopeptide (TPR) repeat protein